jgi:hypothetical protein
MLTAAITHDHVAWDALTNCVKMTDMSWQKDVPEGRLMELQGGTPVYFGMGT